MRAKRYGALLATVAGFVLLPAVPAAAAEPPTASCGYTRNLQDGQLWLCGHGWFYDTGEWEQLTVQDGNYDGHSAVLNWRQGNSDRGNVWATSGVGSRTTEDINFPEDITVSFRICAGEAGTRVILLETCGSWRTATT